MKKRWRIISLLLFFLLLAGCGKSPQESDKKDNITEMVSASREVMTASKTVHKNVIDTLKKVDTKKMNYEGLKNIIKEDQELQRTYLQKIRKQGTTDFRSEVSDKFVTVINSRIQNYEELLSMIRMEDADSLMNALATMEQTDKSVEQNQLVQLNELLKSKKAATIKTLEK